MTPVFLVKPNFSLKDSSTKKPSLRKNEKMVNIFNKDLQAINACGNLRQKLSIFLRPLARRAANTLRPFLVAIRLRKPCLFLLFLTDG